MKTRLAVTAAAMFAWSPARGAAVVAPARPVTVTPAAAQSMASSIGSYFRTAAPDLAALAPVVTTLQKAELDDARTREALAPVYRAVQAQVAPLVSAAQAVGFAAPDRGLAAKFAALEALEDFQTPESRERVSWFTRAYHDALPAEDAGRLRAKLIKLRMDSIAEALGRPAGDDGVPVAEAPRTAPAAWRLAPSRAAEDRP